MERLDKYIKNIIWAHEAAYNPSHWEATKHYIRKQRNKKKRAFWLAGMCTAVLLAILLVPKLMVNEHSFWRTDLKTLEKVNRHLKSDISNDVQGQNNSVTISNQLANNDKKYSIDFSTVDTQKKSPVVLSNKVTKPFQIDDQDQIPHKATLTPIINSNLDVGNNWSGTETPYREKFSNVNLSDEVLPKQTNSEEFNAISKIVVSTANDRENPIAQDTEYLTSANENHLEKLHIETPEALASSDLLQSERIAPHWYKKAEFNLLWNPAPHGDSRLFLGWQPTLLIGYQTQHGVRLASGVGYLHRMGTFHALLDHPTPLFSDIKDDKGFNLIPTSASFLILPLEVGYATGSLYFGLRYQTAILLGAQGKVMHYQGLMTEESPGIFLYKSEEVASGWIETRGLRQWAHEFQFFAEKQLSKNIGLGIRFGFLPWGFIRSDYGLKYDFDIQSYRPIESAGLNENRFQFGVYLNCRL